MPTIYSIIKLAIAITFTIQTLTKTQWRYRLRDICDLYNIPLIPEMLDCDFCLGFWLSVVASIIIAFSTADSYWLITPIFTTPIIRFLL